MTSKPRISALFFSLIFLGAGFFFAAAPTIISAGSNKVIVIELNDDTINPVTAEYIIDSIDLAIEKGAECLIIRLDTPGGLLSSTRLIVKNLLRSSVPIVVYIAPSGSRAGSAGVFITYASHIAAMAPSTNIGAAHPVQMGGQKPKKTGDWDELKELLQGLKEEKKEAQEKKDKKKTKDKVEKSDAVDEIVADDDPMSSKILQDTVAFIKAIAKERGRNIEWAIESVVKSSSITNEEALEKGVIEIIATSDSDLLKKLDGRLVKINDREITLNTIDAQIEYVAMDARQKFFNVLANPNIAYFLMILGFYGLLYEITHPGIGVPGILGVIFLILAFYSMQTLPTNYAGLALMALGIALLIAEAYTPTFGILTFGGLVCLVLGSMLLFESVDPIMRVSKSAIFGFSLSTAGITLFLVRSVIRAHQARKKGGKEGLLGESGEAKSNFGPGKKGKVFLLGENWNAKSEDEISKGDEIEVVQIKGLLLIVKRRA